MFIRSLWLLIVFAAFCTNARAEVDATELVRKVDLVLWGEKSWVGEIELNVVRPDWSRSMVAKLWTVRPSKSFARVVTPAKDAGIGSLVLGTEMWNYIPAIERTVKIPPAMRLQPWMGSDVTNNDVMEQGRMLVDYTHRFLRETVAEGQPVVELELIPKPGAVVAWGRIVLVSRKADAVPVHVSFFDERGTLVRETVYSDVKSMNGHVMPTHWEVRPANKPGQKTVVRILSARLEQPIADDVFSLRNLTRKD